MNSAVKEPLVHMTKREDMSLVMKMAVRIIAILLSLLVCAIFIYGIVKMNPVQVYEGIIDGAVGTERRMWITIRDAMILLCVAVAVTPAFRMRFWNIGAEGQTLMGVLGAITVDFYLGGKIPEGVLLVLMLLAALVYGGVWALIPAVFKARWNTNETLFTLMMNYVATFVVSYFLVIWVPSGSSSLAKLKYGKLPSVVNDYFVIIMVALAPVSTTWGLVMGSGRRSTTTIMVSGAVADATSGLASSAGSWEAPYITPVRLLAWLCRRRLW